jgi:hypothetical protein
MYFDEVTGILTTGAKDRSVKVFYINYSFGNYQRDGHLRKLRNSKEMKSK